MKKSRHQFILHVFAGCGVLALCLGAGLVAAGPPAAQEGALTGKIAFTRFNGQKMNLLVYDLASGKIVAEMANMRHPDLAGGLLANGDGGARRRSCA
jgi:hypothetical protein